MVFSLVLVGAVAQLQRRLGCVCDDRPNVCSIEAWVFTFGIARLVKRQHCDMHVSTCVCQYTEEMIPNAACLPGRGEAVVA